MASFLFYILECDQAFEITTLVYHGQFLNFILLEDFLGLFKRSTNWCSVKWCRCHNILDRPLVILLESQIPICDYPHQSLCAIYNGNASNRIACHECAGIAYCAAYFERDWVKDHSTLGTLDSPCLCRLIFHGHVLVQYSNASLARHCDCKPRFRYRIHSSRKQRDVQLYFPGQSCFNADIPGHDT